MRSVVLRLLGLVTVFLLSVSLIRYAFGELPPLTSSNFLRALSTVDFSFSATYSSLVEIVQTFQNLSIGGWDVVIDVLKAIWKIITLPVDLVKDLATTLYSVLQFLAKILGFMP